MKTKSDQRWMDHRAANWSSVSVRKKTKALAQLMADAKGVSLTQYIENLILKEAKDVSEG